MAATILDRDLPVFDVSDSVATLVDAPLAATWQALMEVDLIEVGRRRPLVGILGAIRALPDVLVHLIRGEAMPDMPARLRLRDLVTLPMSAGGWVLLGERPAEEIALGLTGKFWKPVIEFAPVRTAEEFRAFAAPGFAKTVYALSVRAIDKHHTLLTGTMRTATTDAEARRWFRRYWTFGVGTGAHILVEGLLDVTREAAEAAARATA